MSSNTIVQRPGTAILKRPVKLKTDALTVRVYEAIKEAILDMTAPPGARLNIDQLSRDLGVSISPVREALARLMAERLAVFTPYSGYVVTELPDKKFFQDLVDARLLLECHSAREGAPRRNPAILRIMKRVLWETEDLPIGKRYQDYRKQSEWDACLHSAIIESAGNVALVQVYSDLRPHVQFSRLFLHMQEDADAPRVLAEHRRIIEAFESGDGEAAAEAVRLHLEQTRVWLDRVKPS